MREKILKLREEGKSYNEIAALLGCNKGKIAYTCNPEVRKKAAERQIKNRIKNPFSKKLGAFKSRQINEKVRAFQKRDKKERITFTTEDVKNKFENNHYCYLTGRKLDISQPSTYNFDHIIPFSRGGSCELDNLGLLCKEANRAKNNMTNEEFIELCKEILIHHNYIIIKKE